MKYDVAIIGAGPGGYTAAFKAVDNGLSVILFEQDKVGGTCLNRGCIPTKSLLRSATRFHETRKLVPDYPFDPKPISELRQKTVDTLRSGIEKLVKTKKITLVNERAFIKSEHVITAGDQQYEAENIVIATGSKVSLPPIPGIDSPAVMTSDDLLEKDDLSFSSVAIIGGGVIGVECASIFLDTGKKVTILEIADHILPTMDREIAQRMNTFLRNRGADIYTRATVDRIEGNNVIFTDKKGGQYVFAPERILVAAGRIPNIEGLADPGLNLTVDRGVVGDELGRTSIDNIYVIGDAKSRNIQLAHMAQGQGRNVIDTILNREPEKDLSLIPSCIYTEPEIACVGLSQKEAEEKGIKVTARKVLTGANGRSLIEESDSGYAKIVLNEDNVIIGAQLICPHATEIISELTLAIQQKLTVEQLARIVHPHPTVAEMVGELCQ